MPKAKVTVRQLKNIDTGVDVSITGCKEEAGLLSVKLEYQLLVVSNLSCFKSAEHTTEDVVQFVIRRKHEDFVELHRVLGLKYPQSALPSVSSTGMAIFQDVNVRELKESLEIFLKKVVTDKELATSYLTLQFLGVNPIVAGNFQGNKGLSSQLSSKQGIFEEDRDEEDLFAELGDQNTETAETDDLFKHVATGRPQSQEGSVNTKLFDDQDLGGEKEDLSELLLPDSSTQFSGTALSSSQQEEDDLLNITDDLDNLLKPTNRQKDSKKQSSLKPKILPKPGAKPSLPPKPKQTMSAKEPPADTDLGADDILKYIEDATSQQEQEVDLFS